MYCPNCGKETTPGARFCENCGTVLSSVQPMNQPYYSQAPPQYQPSPQYQTAPPYYGHQPMYAPVPTKSAGIAAILAFLIPGLGHLYLGKIGEGLLYLVLCFILAALWFLIVPIIILAIVWIWQIFDAHNQANYYNAAVQQTGRAPW